MRVDLYEFTDLLFCAKELGYRWNQAHDILVKDGVHPSCTEKIKKFEKDDIESWDYSDDTIKILNAFFEQEGLEEFVIF